MINFIVFKELVFRLLVKFDFGVIFFWFFFSCLVIIFMIFVGILLLVIKFFFYLKLFKCCVFNFI